MRGLGFAHNILFKEKGLTEAFSEDLNCGRSEMEFFSDEQNLKGKY